MFTFTFTFTVTSLLPLPFLSTISRAKNDYDNNKKMVKTFDEFCAALDKRNVMLAPYCGVDECEDRIKKDSAR
jgi:hypothetical protein